MSIDDGGQPFGVAEQLDEVLLRLDGWRARPGLVLTIGLGVAAIAAISWWLARPSPEVPLEELIPMAEPDGSAPIDTPVAEDGSSRTAGPGSTDGVRGSDTEVDVGPGDEPPEPDLIVHVVGAVRLPGLVTVSNGSRVGDVVIAAGGAVDGADIQRLNLAAPVSDGMQVRVPLLDDDPDEPLIIVAPATASQPGGSAGGSSSGATDGPIDLNTATAEQLEELPGVGPAIASAIITWRDENGGFAHPDDLLRVPGIGPAKMGALRDRVAV